MLITKNYKFKKPELTDSPPDITVMNPNWDDIDDKLFKVIQAWEDFKANGGEVGTNKSEANIILPGYLKCRGVMSSEGDASFGIFGNLTPWAATNEQTIGVPGYPFKNAFIGSSGGDNNNGHTKLTNGYLMQWGQITVPANSEATITYPLYYSSPTYPVITPIGNRANGPSSVTSFGTNWAKIYNGSNISMTFKVIAIGK